MAEKILIVGHSPGKIVKSKSPTRNRVKHWLNSAGIEEYDWTNLVHYNVPGLKMSDVTLDPKWVMGYDRVIALGRSAEQWLSRQEIKHLAVPHPSGLNRAWNDPSVEPEVMDNIKKYLKKS